MRSSAERRLRSILETQRHHVEANLALAELLVTTDRAADAAEHLRETLGSMPDEASGVDTARLVHRFAQVMAALGDDDEAHQLLHEAHRLDVVFEV